MRAVVDLSSIYLSAEYFGRRFNYQPIAIFDVPEPSDTGKTLNDFCRDIHSLGVR